MKVLTVFADPASKSFCHAVLDRFYAGLRDAGHTNEIGSIASGRQGLRTISLRKRGVATSTAVSRSSRIRRR